MDVSLPKRLQERLRWEVAADSAVPREGFVLYWMHHALRGHENPALDVAICLARQNQLPLLVYQALCETHLYASDRHHAFILQGARDVQRELAERGIRYAFHLQRTGARGPHLKSLARAAAVMVTEVTPVEPILGWLERLVASTTTPIATVDTACVVPMPTTDRLWTDLTEFRHAVGPEFAHRVREPWEDEPASCSPYQGWLPFEPLDLQDQDLARLIGECSIDHSVAPVIGTPGGTRAGYARWEACKSESRGQFAVPLGSAQESRASEAPQPALVAVAAAAELVGANRMSPYLHYGMVSPLRLAREAQQMGAEDFLDTFLIERELAYHFCHRLQDSLETFDALPEWAAQTLVAHASDPRESDLTWEQLARARTEDPVWDAWQRGLLRHGELAPESRRNWSKAILQWTADPQHALQLALDLNHRYALDGRDPHSYSTLLSGFGQFDQPAAIERPVLGRVRPREATANAVKDSGTAGSLSWMVRPTVAHHPRIAVVGAGIAGLMAARTLCDLGVDVTVFDRSYRVGGRLATRHATSGTPFDHGAQYFTIRDDRFARYVRAWIQAGIAAPWNGRIVELRQGAVVGTKVDPPRYVGVPGMRSIAEHLAADLMVVPETHVAPLRGQPGSWQLQSEDGRELGEFELVIANCPPRQAATLLAAQPSLAETIRGIPMAPCWAVMLELERPPGLDFDAAFVHQSPLGWIARNNSKPRRGGRDAWVLHASSEWSAEHLEDSPEEVTVKLLAAFTAATGATVSQPVSIAAHRWRSALPVETLEQACVWEPAAGLGACGDWCGGPRIEGAFLSGAAIAGSILRHLTIDRRG